MEQELRVKDKTRIRIVGIFSIVVIIC